MSPEEYVRVCPETNDLRGTELTLALPGTPIRASDGRQKSGNNRRFIETNYNKSITNGRLVGWPPVKVTRRKYVKVALDGAAYLRKVDLEMYDCYRQLLTALENMFQVVITISKVPEMKRKGVHVEFMATYEDKDGDWMLVGDVPWMMFVESCKRMRLMKTVDAIGLVPR
ncbi:hypothetical protein AALP_AA2G255800 [Arabis alpina]|uniref:Auxin-responsive protein n=1 Tax=Arabis alpina TaxID=50452 RepID=A0A087HJY1_ARAAL|nr:hypothetical protein AALP_AA2G255800 [Arabis alpina]